MMGNQFTPERAEHENQKRRELERRFAEWLERQPLVGIIEVFDCEEDSSIRNLMFSAFRAGSECQ